MVMSRMRSTSPTLGELRILQVLWNNGPSTVSAVYEALDPLHAGKYTTNLKFLQIMYEKQLVVRNDQSRAHVYEAAISERDVQQQMTEELIEKAFRGSTLELLRTLAQGEFLLESEAPILQSCLRKLEKSKKSQDK